MVTNILISVGVAILAAVAEWMHWQRIRKVARLAFGPTGKPSLFGMIAPWFRVPMLGLLTWGLVTLLSIDPESHRSEIDKKEEVKESDKQHLVLIVDVSPSMRLTDAGKNGKLTRLERTSHIIESLFARLNQDYLHLSIIATYNGAVPVVVDTRDIELIYSLLEVPLYFAFKVGETKLLDGVNAASEIAKKWKKDSTTFVIVSDGETVPPTGMKSLPPSVSDVLVVGVGSTKKGVFFNGKHSRQDTASLKQIASRLGGAYHNANEKHVPTDTVKSFGSLSTGGKELSFAKREWALLSITISAVVLALLPMLLYYFGSRKTFTLNHNQ